MLNYVFPFWGVLEFQSSRFVSGGPGNSKTRKTSKNNKIKFLLFIPRLSLGMKNPKTPKTKQFENNKF